MGTGWGAGEANQIKLPREQLHTNGIGKVFVFFERVSDSLYDPVATSTSGRGH